MKKGDIVWCVKELFPKKLEVKSVGAYITCYHFWKDYGTEEEKRDNYATRYTEGEIYLTKENAVLECLKERKEKAEDLKKEAEKNNRYIKVIETCIEKYKEEK